MENTKKKLSDNQNENQVNLEGTLKKIARKKNEKLLYIQKDKTKFELKLKRGRSETDIKKKSSLRANCRKSSLEKMLKNFRKDTKIFTRKTNNSGFLDKVKKTIKQRKFFNERKESQTERFKKNVQNQYFALRKFMRNKTKEYKSKKSLTEQRETLRKSIRTNSKEATKDIQGPFLNNSYSISLLKSQFKLKRGGLGLLSQRINSKKNSSPKLEGNSHLSEIRKSGSGIDYDLSNMNQRSFLKNGLPHIDNFLIRRISNGSKYQLRSENRGSITPRLSHGILELNSLGKRISERLNLRENRNMNTFEF